MAVEVVQLIYFVGSVIICSYATAFIPKFVSAILPHIFRDENCRLLRQQINTVSDELRHISAVHEFAKYSRKNRELNRLQDELKKITSMHASKSLAYSIGLQAICYVITTAAGIFLFRSYYGIPLLEFPAPWFYPFHRVMAWPGLSASETTHPVSAVFVSFVVCYLLRKLAWSKTGTVTL